jgi:hypothetical protein
VKLLITTDCAVPTMDGPTHVSANTLVDIDADTAHLLVQATRAQYIDPKDDRSRSKVNTASESRVEAVRAAIKAAGKAPKAAEA